MIIDIDVFIDKLEFSIFSIENQYKKYILKDKIIIPISFDVGNRLSYLRKFISILLRQHKIEMAYLHTNDNLDTEDLSIDIIKIIGVMEELFSSCGVELCK